MIYENLKTGINPLDEQHEKFGQAIDLLEKAVRENETPKDILQKIKDLDFYFTHHIDYEEGLAEQTNFERLQDLKDNHKDFQSACNRVKKYYENYQERTSRIYAIYLTSVIREWLDAHMQYVELELIGHLKKAISEGFEP